MVCHENVRAVLKHLGWYADSQVLVGEHARCFITRLISIMQNGTAPLLTFDGLRTDCQQLADSILDGTDVAASIDNLRLHAQV